METRLMMLGALLATATVAQAADETGKWYLNPQGGYLWAGDDRFVDDDYYYGPGATVDASVVLRTRYLSQLAQECLARS